MKPWLQLINNCTALKHRLDFLFQFSFWRKFRSRSKKKIYISTIFWVWNYSLFCHQKLVPFGKCIGLVFLFCFFFVVVCLFFLVCLLPCLFVFSLVCLEIIESIIKSFITFGLFALIFFTYHGLLWNKTSDRSVHLVYISQNNQMKLNWKDENKIYFTLLKSKVLLFTNLLTQRVLEDLIQKNESSMHGHQERFIIDWGLND